MARFTFLAAAILALAASSLSSIEAGKMEKDKQDELFSRLLQQESKFLQAAVEKENWKMVRGSAALLACYAQTRIEAKAPNRENPAAVRDHALKLTQKIDAAEARKLAKALPDKIKDKAKPDKTPPELEKYRDWEFLHRLFASEKVGGPGIERDLENMNRPDAALKKDVRAKLAVQAYRAAVLGEATEMHFRDAAAKTKLGKGLVDWAAHSRQTALDVAGHAAAGDERDLRQSLAGLNESCNVCHNSFRVGALPPVPARKK